MAYNPYKKKGGGLDDLYKFLSIVNMFKDKGSSNVLSPATKFQQAISNMFVRMGSDPTYPGEDKERLANMGDIIQNFHDTTNKRFPGDTVGTGMINEEAQNVISGMKGLIDDYDEFNTNYITGSEVTDPSTAKVTKIPSFREKVMTGSNEARQLAIDLLDKDNIDVSTAEGKAKIRDLNSRTIKWQDDWLSIMQQQDTYSTKIMTKFQKRSNFLTEISPNIQNTGNVIKAVWDEMKGKTLLNQEEHKTIQEALTTKNWKAYFDLEARQRTTDESIVSEFKTKINQTQRQIQTIQNAIDLDKGRVRAGKRIKGGEYFQTDDPDEALIYGFQDQNLTVMDARELIEDYKLDIIQARTSMVKSVETYPHTKFEDIKEEAALYPAPPPEIEPELEVETIPDGSVPGGKREITSKSWDISIHGKGSNRSQRTKNRMQTYKVNAETLGDWLQFYEDNGGADSLGTFDKALEDNKENVKVGKKPAFVSDVPEPVIKKEKVTDKKELTADNLVDEYAKVYKYGFNRTPEGKAFEKKHGINNKIMNKLSEIENTKNSGSPEAYKQKAIDKKKADIDSRLEKVLIKSKEAKLDKAKSLVKIYANKGKVSPEDIELIKSAIPNIDEIIAAYQAESKVAIKYGSGATFYGFLEGNAKYKEGVDYEKLAGLF